MSRKIRTTPEGCWYSGKSGPNDVLSVVFGSGREIKPVWFYSKKVIKDCEKRTGEWLTYRKSINCAIRVTCGMKTCCVLFDDKWELVSSPPFVIPIPHQSNWLRTNAQRYIWKCGKFTAGKTQPNSSNLAVSSWTIRQCGWPWDWSPLLELVTHWVSSADNIRMCWLQISDEKVMKWSFKKNGIH